ncbi:MAG: carbon-nitrogen hydrolase family protein [Verrucomicrobia bacterium]|nr:carbon-nitrogen hydrolase family protein [Verrucomicrobiota bacterium]
MKNTVPRASQASLFHLLASLLFVLHLPTHAAASDFQGWSLESPRSEIRPKFSSDAKGSLIITHDQREGLDGWFQKSFPVSGGEVYRFQVRRKVNHVALPRQSCLVRISWQDTAGKMVYLDGRPEHADPKLPVPSAEPEYPTDGATDAQGWTTVGGIYKCPAKAARAVVELHLQWAPGGRVEWSGAEFAKGEPPPARKVRLATIHYKPTGKSPRANCEEYAPLIAEAALRKADLVVLGETVPTAGVKLKSEVELAEPIPGPTTDYFGGLAAKHGLHIVVSIYERAGHLVYNAAVLIGPDGRLLGKYRKVSLPPGEAAKGIAPGRDFPVFDTAFGKVGMMVCYDGFFPEVARELAKNGAEVIAWPVWGCNPLLAEARACENHVYLISSTFMGSNDGWMRSAVFDHNGKPIAQATNWGTVGIAEVTLNQPYHGPYNLGDFRSMVPRHRPPVPGELPATTAK